jgi:hypothetical protein
LLHAETDVSIPFLTKIITGYVQHAGWNWSIQEARKNRTAFEAGIVTLPAIIPSFQLVSAAADFHGSDGLFTSPAKRIDTKGCARL